MKCPMCNGSGKCYEQKIRYQEIETNRTDFTIAKCHKCNGTGEVEQTNEEWFAGLSTKEKAKWLFRLTYKCYWCGREYDKTKKYNEKDCPFHRCLDDSKGFKKWLKEKRE